MPDFGSPVAQNVKGPDLGTLSDMMSLQQKQLNLRKSQDTYNADVSQRQSESSLAGTNASVAAQTAAPRVAQQIAQTGLEQFKLTGAHAAQAMQLASGMLGDPVFVKGDSAGMMDRLNAAHDTMTQQYGIDPKIADATITTLKYQALHNPTQVRQSLINMTQQQQGGAGQQAAALPNSQLVPTGNTITPVASGNPALTGGVQPGTPQGQPVPMGLPPSTPVMRDGRPGYLGGDPKVASGPALGQAAGVEGPVTTNNAHFAQVQSDAATASTRVAALQTIKSEAPAAVTGGGDYRRKFISQISGLFGFANDAQTATDVMAKNLSVLASQAGNTDAARSLGEMANPSFHMTADAVKKTSDQLIGIEAKKVAAQRLFTGTPTNSPEYAQKLQEWNAHSDPRAFEYARKSPAEQAVMKAEMVKAGTWSELQQHGMALHKMGVTP